jgi:dienelactone hydrolase
MKPARLDSPPTCLRVWRATPVLILPVLLVSCIQPMRLAHDDSPSVLAHQALAAPNPGEPGSYRVLTLTYGSGTDKRRAAFRDSVTMRTRSVDGSKFASGPSPAQSRARKKFFGFGFDSMPINGRVWYPDGMGPFPLVLIVHGNHDMTQFSDPGYRYLGELFASRGYIFASVDENFLNGNIRGENDARGWMLLQHLTAWKRFTDSAAGPLSHKVDLSRIALMGHSRGGEAVAVAAAFNTLSHYPDDATIPFNFHFGIRAVVAIAPVDGQYEPANRPTPLENVNYLVIHGSHDGDVSTFSGLRQYERVRFTDGASHFKAAVWMYRANHGQWNTVWGSTDDGPESGRYLDLRGLIPAEQQRQMARVYLSAFLEASLRDRAEYLPIFRDHRVIGGWLPKTMYITRFQDNNYHALAEFTEDVDVATGTAAGVLIRGDSLATWKEAVMPLRSRNGNVGRNAVWVGWNNRIAGKDTTKIGPPASYAISLTDSLRSAWHIGSTTVLEFSMAPTDATPKPRAVPKDTTKKSTPDLLKGKARRSSEKKLPEPKKNPEVKDSLPIQLSVEAVDGAGVAVRLPVSRYGIARRPLEATVKRRKGRDKQSFGSLFELIPQTYVIPLADFQARDRRFTPATLASVRWVFDGTVAGTVILADIGLSNLAAAFLTPSLP